MKVLEVAVWGLGRHALKNIIPAIKNCSGLNLYGVCSRNKDVVSEVVLETGCKYWTKPEQMLEDNNVDAVYLSTPTGLHYSQSKEVLLASKHLWCEKPLATSLAQVKELVELAKAKSLTIGESFMYLYHPHFLQLQQIISSRKLGCIIKVNCRFGIPPLEQPGFRNNPDLGGSAFYDVGCYLASAIVGLFPNSKIHVLFSQIKTVPGSEVDTSGLALLHIGDIDIMLDWTTSGSYRNEIDIWGTHASVSTTKIFSKPADYVPQFIFSDVHGKITKVYGEPCNHFIEMFRSFLQNVSDGDKAILERQEILKRAHLMNAIGDHKILQDY